MAIDLSMLEDLYKQDEEAPPEELTTPTNVDDALTQTFQVDPKVLAAREERDKRVADAGLLQGLTQIGTSLASGGQSQFDPAVFENIKKSAGDQEKQVESDALSRRKQVSDYIKSQALASKAAAADDWRNKNFEQRDRAIEATRINRETDRTDKKEHEAKPSDSQVSTITDFDNVLKSLNEIEANKDKFDTGPIAGRLHSAAAAIGVADPKKAAFAASVGENLADYLKSKSGATVSAQERSQLMQNVPTINDNDEIFKEKVKYLRNRIGDHRSTFLSNAEKQGKNVTAFKGSAGGFPRKVSNGAGKVATVSNESEAQAAAAKGFH